jgi:hypothetical protein
VCDGMDRSHVDVASSGLATERSHKGQGTVRRHSAGTNIVDQPEAGTARRVVERGKRSGEQLWRVRDHREREGTSSSV